MGETLVSDKSGNKLDNLKEGLFGVIVDDYRKKHEQEFKLIKDKDISQEEKNVLAKALVTDFLRTHGYEGKLPEVMLTDSEHSFTQDGKNKETGEKRTEKIFFSIHNLDNPEIGFAKLMTHLNTYPEGQDGEESSLYARGKVGESKKEFSAKEKEEYIKEIAEKYPIEKSVEEQFVEAKKVPESEREHFIFLDLLTNSKMTEEPQIVSKDSNDIKQAGNQFYYNGYRIASMSTLKNNDDEYIVELDYSSKLPKDDIITTGISAVKLLTLITNPVEIITKSKEIKNELKNLTSKERVVSSNTDDVMKKLGVKNPDIKLLENKKSIVSKDGWRIEELKKLPSSKTSDIKEITEGGVREAKEFFFNNIDTKTIKQIGKDKFIGKYKYDSNITVTYRKESSALSKNVPTVDFQVKGLRKIKFIGGENNVKK